jgi:hypothetical protein
MSKGKRGKQVSGGQKKTQSQAPNRPQAIDFKFTIRGVVVDVSKLPTTNNAVGDVWITLDEDHRGHRWRWSSTEWENITTSFSVKGLVDDVAKLPIASNAEGDVWLTTNDVHRWRWSGSEWINQGPYKGIGKRFNQAAIDKYLAKVDLKNGARVFSAVVECMRIGLLPPPEIIRVFVNRADRATTYQAGLDEAYNISRKRKKREKGPQFGKEQEFYKLVCLITAIVVKRNKKGQNIDFLMFEDVAKDCRKHELTKTLELSRSQAEKIYERGKREIPWIWALMQAFGVNILDEPWGDAVEST